MDGNSQKQKIPQNKVDEGDRRNPKEIRYDGMLGSTFWTNPYSNRPKKEGSKQSCSCFIKKDIFVTETVFFRKSIPLASQVGFTNMAAQQQSQISDHLRFMFSLQIGTAIFFLLRLLYEFYLNRASLLLLFY